VTPVLSGASGPSAVHGSGAITAPRAARRTATLLAVSHGTSSASGQEAVGALVDAVAASLPGRHVAGGFVDVQQPDVPASLDALDEGAEAVIVPLLLSAGYHVHVDLVREAASSSRPTRIARALGPDPRLVDVLERRLVEAGLRDDDVVVLGAAGSSDARAVADCRVVADHLGGRIGRPVEAAFISAATPRLEDAVTAARAAHPGRRIVISTYLLAPGYFATLARRAGADLATRPLLVHGEEPPAELVEIVRDRFRAVDPGAPHGR
jgi:sirohydrochlorin ferrochelatase